MTLPVIGLTAYRGLNGKDSPIVALMESYLFAVTEAGGVPVLVPPGLSDAASRELYTRLDGILLTGGGDIAPERFGGQPHPKIGDVDPERDAVEFSLLSGAVDRKKPFLGICRGFQVVTVGLGGTLYTHLPDQFPGALEHDYEKNHPRDYLAHPVNVTQGSRLAQALGEIRLSVNSLHHQGAKELPPALMPVAWSPDGLVEAVELTGHPFGIGVQWHPECLPDQPAARRLFKAFVEAADRCKENR